MGGDSFGSYEDIFHCLQHPRSAIRLDTDNGDILRGEIYNNAAVWCVAVRGIINDVIAFLFIKLSFDTSSITPTSLNSN